LRPRIVSDRFGYGCAALRLIAATARRLDDPALARRACSDPRNVLFIPRKTYALGAYLFMSDLSPAIEVENLVKTYAGVAAVNQVSFTVQRGEILGFLGPNGAGKSTTMRILTGFLPATSGIVRLCGVPVATHIAARSAPSYTRSPSAWPAAQPARLVPPGSRLRPRRRI
jgi:ABC-type glutathione transport system ATPase component